MTAPPEKPAQTTGAASPIPVGGMVVSTDGNEVLSTNEMASDLAIGLYDPSQRIGGVAHFMFPSIDMDPQRGMTSPELFADSAFALLLERIERAGAIRHQLLGYVAGGADLLQPANGTDDAMLGSSNADAAARALQAAGMAVTATRVGGHQCRRLIMEVGTGVVRITETPYPGTAE